MRKSLILFSLVAVIFLLQACSSKTPDIKDPVDEDPIDEPVDEIKYVTEIISEERPLFSQGLLPVRIDGKWGYVDKTGAIIIQPQFAKAFAFRSNKLAIVASKESNASSLAYGVIDLEGKYVIRPSNTYYNMTLLENGTFHVFTSEGDKILDRNGVVIFDEQKFNQRIQADETITKKYEYWNPDFSFSGGVFSAGAYFDGNVYKCGYMTIDGEWAIEPKYNRCGDFGANGLAYVIFGNDEDRFSNIGFIDKNGAVVHQPRKSWSVLNFTDQRFNYDGYFIMSDAETRLIGVIDAQGNNVIEPKYEALTNFVDNLAIYSYEVEKSIYEVIPYYGLIDITGKVLVKPGVYAELGPISNGFIQFTDKKTYKVGYLDYQGKVAIPAKFSEYVQNDTLVWGDLDQVSGRFMDDGYAIVVVNKKLNVIDTNGTLLFENGFDAIYEYDEYNDPYPVIRFQD